MKIKLKLTLIIIFSIIIFLGAIGFVIYKIEQAQKMVQNEVPKIINDLGQASLADNNSNFIRYYDEVLTQSARNYALTSDVKWQERYNQNAIKLNEVIKTAKESDDIKDLEYLGNIDKANVDLIALEESSMAKVEGGQKNEAIKILDSAQYQQLKKVYEDNLKSLIEKHGDEFDKVQAISTTNIEVINQQTQQNLQIIYYILIGLFVFALVVLIIINYIFNFQIISQVNELKIITQKIAKGDYGQKTQNISSDEMGELSKNINYMSDEIKTSKANIEAKVRDRTQTLNKINKIMIGRELKMIELKKKVKDSEKI